MTYLALKRSLARTLAFIGKTETTQKTIKNDKLKRVLTSKNK